MKKIILAFIIIIPTVFFMACNNEKLSDNDSKTLSYIEGHKIEFLKDNQLSYSFENSNEENPYATYWFIELNNIINRSPPNIKLNWMDTYKKSDGFSFNTNENQKSETFSLNDTYNAIKLYKMLNINITNKDKIIESVLRLKEPNGQFINGEFEDNIFTTNISLDILKELGFNFEELKDTKIYLQNEYNNLIKQKKVLNLSTSSELETIALFDSINIIGDINKEKRKFIKDIIQQSVNEIKFIENDITIA